MLRGRATTRVRSMAKTLPQLHEFYLFYLSEHANRTSRRLHFTGTSIALALLIARSLRKSSYRRGADSRLRGLRGISSSSTTSPRPSSTGLSLMGDWRLWWIF